MSDPGIGQHGTSGGAPPEHGVPAGAPRRELLIGLVLSAAVFAFHFALESKLRAIGAFVCFNTLFNADPGLTLEAICSGGGGNHLSHPLLEYLFSIPIRAIARLGSAVSSGGLDRDLVKLTLGMLVAPVAAGFQTFVSLRVLRMLGLSFRSALLLAVLGSVSFSKLLLGSMPESYCLSALCISLAYLLFLRTRGRRGIRVELSWFALGVLTAGITLTNVVAVAILYFVRVRTGERKTWGTILSTGAMAALVLLVTLGVGKGLDTLFDAQPGRTPDEMVWISRYFVDDPTVQLATFPTAVVDGIAPQVPERKPNRFALKAERAAAKSEKAAAGGRPARLPGIPMPGTVAGGDAVARGSAGGDEPSGDAAGRDAPGGASAAVVADKAPDNTSAPVAANRLILFSLTLQRVHDPRSVRNLIGIALLASLAWVALRDGRIDQTFRSLARASLAVIAFNWVLHGFWGGEQFLYSQHWHVSLLVLLGAAVSALEVRGRNALAPLVILVVGVAVSNSIVLAKTLEALTNG